jgi:DUF4097 and DUF4098 domain-containing protein YvlB
MHEVNGNVQVRLGMHEVNGNVQVRLGMHVVNGNVQVRLGMHVVFLTLLKKNLIKPTVEVDKKRLIKTSL